MFQLNGSLSIVLTDDNGKTKDERYIPNTVVLDGKNFIINRMFYTTPDSTADYKIMKYMELGTSTTYISSTTLDSVITGSRLDMDANPPTSSITRGAGSTAAITYVAFYKGTGGTPSTAFPDTTSTLAITEAGIFNAASGGKMLCKTNFAVVNKLPADALTINWTISIT